MGILNTVPHCVGRMLANTAKDGVGADAMKWAVLNKGHSSFFVT